MTNNNKNIQNTNFSMNDYLLGVFSGHKNLLWHCVALRLATLVLYAMLGYIDVVYTILHLNNKLHIGLIVAIVLFLLLSIVNYIRSQVEQRALAFISIGNCREMLHKLWGLPFTEQASFENPSFAIESAASAVKLTLINYLIYMDVVFNIYVFAVVIVSANLWMLLPVILVCGSSTLIIAYGMYRVAQIKKAPPSYSRLINYAARIFEFSIYNESANLIHAVNTENEKIQSYQQNIMLYQLRISIRAGVVLIAGSYGILFRVIDFTSIGSFAFYSYMVAELLVQLNCIMYAASNQISINIASIALVKLHNAKPRPHSNQIHLLDSFKINVKDLSWMDDYGLQCSIKDWIISQGDVWLLSGDSVKTTSLLRVIAGIQNSINSSITVNSNNSEQITWNSLFVSSVFASTCAPLPRGTVHDSFRMLTDNVNVEIMQGYLDMVELYNKLDNDVVTLSGGEKSRLHIARNLYRIYISQLTEYPIKLLLLSEIDRGIDTARSERIVSKIIESSKNILIIGIAHKTSIRRLFLQTLDI